MNDSSCILPADLVEEDSLLDIIYPWPFLGSTVIITAVIALLVCIGKPIHFRESVIALISFSEILSWVAFILLLYSDTDGDFFNIYLLLACVAILVHIILNIVYGIVH